MLSLIFNFNKLEYTLDFINLFNIILFHDQHRRIQRFAGMGGGDVKEMSSLNINLQECYSCYICTDTHSNFFFINYSKPSEICRGSIFNKHYIMTGP